MAPILRTFPQNRWLKYLFSGGSAVFEGHFAGPFFLRITGRLSMFPDGSSAPAWRSSIFHREAGNDMEAA
jgi:hypothetical protein